VGKEVGSRNAEVGKKKVGSWEVGKMRRQLEVGMRNAEVGKEEVEKLGR